MVNAIRAGWKSQIERLASLRSRPWCLVQQSDCSLSHYCHSRPFAAIGHHLKMLQRGPSLRTFVQLAAFCRLKRRSADKAPFRCGSYQGLVY
jgi:hypothetical protein